MAAPVHTTSELQDPAVIADPASAATFVARRGGRVLAYLRAVTTEDRALPAAGEAFAGFRLARALHPDAEAEATSLLRATRRAATAHAENPYRPEGRARPARRIGACDAMPRMLVAWTEARLGDADVARLVAHLGDCPDCHALRDAFDVAERGYRAGEAAALSDAEVTAMATAMAAAAPAPRAGSAAAPRPGPGSDVPGAPGTTGGADSDGGSGTDARSGTERGARTRRGTEPPVRSTPDPATTPSPRHTEAPAAPRHPAAPAAEVPRSGAPTRRRTAIPARPARDATATRSTSPTAAGSGDRPTAMGGPGEQTSPAAGSVDRRPVVPALRVDRSAPTADRRAVAGRRTAIPERPATRVPAIAAPAPTSAPNGHLRATDPATSPNGRATPQAPATTAATPLPAARGPVEAIEATPATRPARGADPSDDPFGPEALGYAVPRSGLPRPERRPAVPRVRRRRVGRPAHAAVAAAGVVAAAAATARRGDDRPTRGDTGAGRTDGGATSDAPGRELVETGRPGDGAPTATTDEGSARPAVKGTRDLPEAGSADGERASVAPVDGPDPAKAVAPAASDERDPAGPCTPVAPATVDVEGPSGAVVPATINGGLAATRRRALDAPLVRQLGVPAVLLLAVLIAVLIAAGVFAGRQEETVAPITRPTIPTVPADPTDIPPLR